MSTKTFPISIGFIILSLLVACGKQTVILPTKTPLPTPLLPTEILIPTASATSVSTPTFLPITPSPLPTEPIIPLLTPDANQVKRWNEFEEALAKAFFRTSYQPEKFVCEWLIFGQAEMEIYVYAYCSEIYASGPSAAEIPAIVHLNADGSVQNAELPGSGSLYGPDIRRMFPQDVSDKIFSPAIHSHELWQPLDDRMRWRRAHPETPPLIVLPFLPAQPAPTSFPWVTLDPVQVKHWKEYQTAFAKNDYRPPEEIICEWEILGQSNNEVYVWAICGSVRGERGFEGLAILHVEDDGTVQYADTSGSLGFAFPSEIRNAFPPDVQEKYFNGLIHFQELVDHLRWRQSQEHWEEPPLIVLKTTANP